MSEHTHTELVEGCYRCDLNRDEMAECPHHCDYCAPDIWHGCVLMKGHTGDHSCTDEMAECPHHCDYCAPDIWHGCVLMKGHTGYHSCTEAS